MNRHGGSNRKPLELHLSLLVVERLSLLLIFSVISEKISLIISVSERLYALRSMPSAGEVN